MSQFQIFFAAKFTRPLVRQIMAVIQRDIVNALAAVNDQPGVLLPPARYALSEGNFGQWPIIQVYPGKVQFLHPDTVQSRNSISSIEISVGVSNQDADVLAETTELYIAAVDGIVASLGAQVNNNYFPNFNDFYTPLPMIIPYPQAPDKSAINVTTTPLAQGSVLSCYPVAHEYTEQSKLTQGLSMRATLILNVEVEEANSQ